MVNSYGLTEATIDSTYFGGLPEDVEGEDTPVPIGRPLPGTRHVRPGRAARAGSGRRDRRAVYRRLGRGAGLCLQSAVRRPSGSCRTRTASRDSRMYATGDRARWREGGVLELLGRRDGQVKVRGFRVELAEVEAVLARHPNVTEAVVVVVIDALGEKRLAAYVVPGSVPVPTASDLRRWLQDRMPEPMIPSSFVFLEALPLSPNGKLDRSALPTSRRTLMGTARQTEYVPPRTTAEEILAGIVADLLGRSRVGVHDNFFEIGVDSILGIQMVSRARQAGLALDPAHLFRHPNIAELAAAAESNSDHQGSSGNSTSASRTVRADSRGRRPRGGEARLSRTTVALRICIPSRRCRKGCSSIRSPIPRRGTTSSSSSAVFEASSTCPHSRSRGIAWSPGIPLCGQQSIGSISIGLTRSSIVGPTSPWNTRIGEG